MGLGRRSSTWTTASWMATSRRCSRFARLARLRPGRAPARARPRLFHRSPLAGLVRLRGGRSRARVVALTRRLPGLPGPGPDSAASSVNGGVRRQADGLADLAVAGLSCSAELGEGEQACVAAGAVRDLLARVRVAASRRAATVGRGSASGCGRRGCRKVSSSAGPPRPAWRACRRGRRGAGQPQRRAQRRWRPGRRGRPRLGSSPTRNRRRYRGLGAWTRPVPRRVGPRGHGRNVAQAQTVPNMASKQGFRRCARCATARCGRPTQPRATRILLSRSLMAGPRRQCGMLHWKSRSPSTRWLSAQGSPR